MKTRHAALLFALGLMLTLLCACGQSESYTKGNTRQSDREVTVSELYSEEGNAADSQEMGYTYSYHVPQIEDDTADAAAINEEIAALYGELAETGLKNIENQEIPGCNIVTYESCRSGDVLALVMKCAFYYGPFEEYGVYNYDTAKGVRLTNADILAMKGLTQEQYLSAVRRAAAKWYDDQYFPLWEDAGLDGSPGAYQERRSWTLSAKNITLDLPLYLNGDGAIHTITSVGCHSGADWLYQTLTLDAEEDAVNVETVDSFDFLTVTRRGREITLRFHETLRGDAVLEACGYMGDVPYGKELPVNGLYGNYTRVFCDTIGELGAPYVFLLTEEGRVEYVDVLSCLKAGYFCASGPLLGVSDVNSIFSASDDDGFQHVYAITGSEEAIDLNRRIAADQNTMAERLVGVWGSSRTADGEEKYLSLTLAGCDSFDLTCYYPGRDAETGATGYLIYLGMTADGAVYAYRSWGRYSGGPVLEGAIALNAAYDYGEIIPAFTLHITELGGTPFIGERTGETTVLAQTFG